MLLTAVAFALAIADIDPVLAKQYFTEAREASDRDGGKMWGKPIVGPLMFVDPQTKKCVANEPDEEHELVAQDGVWTGQLPADTSVANTSFTFGGKSYAMVVWPLPMEKPLRVSLMVHESWHRIQASVGLPANTAVGNYFGETNARVWLRLEMRALAVALADPTRTAIGVACDALRFRQMRYAEFKEAEATETALERHEGLAEYTGTRIGFTEDAAMVDHIDGELKAFEKEESMSRSFPYRTGPAYGALLDRFRTSWRTDLKSGKGLAQLLAEALHQDWAGKADVSADDEAIYGGPSIRKEETDRAVSRANHMRELRALLVEGPVLDVTLSRPKMSFDPGTLFSLGADGEAYGVMKIIDDWGNVEVKSGAGLLTQWKRLRVGLPDGFGESSRSGKGWTLELNPGWKLEPGSRSGDWTITRA